MIAKSPDIPVKSQSMRHVDDYLEIGQKGRRVGRSFGRKRAADLAIARKAGADLAGRAAANCRANRSSGRRFRSRCL